MTAQIYGLFWSSIALCGLTLAHLVIFAGFLGSDIKPDGECAAEDDCPSWMIPNNAWIYLLLAALELGSLLASLFFIFTPYRMKVTNSKLKYIPINRAVASFASSVFLPMWLISSMLSLATSRRSDGKYTDNKEYRMFIAAAAIFVAFDMLFIWLVSGVNQIWIDKAPVALNTTTKVQKKQTYTYFKCSCIIIAIRLLLSLIFLFIQFIMDFSLSNATDNAQISLSSLGGFMMMLIMMLYKIYMIQIMIKKAIFVHKDVFLRKAAVFDIAQMKAEQLESTNSTNMVAMHTVNRALEETSNGEFSDSSD